MTLLLQLVKKLSWSLKASTTKICSLVLCVNGKGHRQILGASVFLLIFRLLPFSGERNQKLWLNLEATKIYLTSWTLQIFRTVWLVQTLVLLCTRWTSWTSRSKCLIYYSNCSKLGIKSSCCYKIKNPYLKKKRKTQSTVSR